VKGSPFAYVTKLGFPSAWDIKAEKQKKEKTKMSEIPKTKEACEEAGGTWDEENQKCNIPKANLMDRYKLALAKVEAQDITIKHLRSQLDEATNEFNAISAKIDAAASAEKDGLIQYFIEDSKDNMGHPTLTADDFKDFDLKQLYDHKKLLAKSGSTGFISVARQRQEDAHKKPHGTVGIYNPTTKKWEDGI